MQDLLTKKDLRIFEEEMMAAIRGAFRRSLWMGTVGTAVVNGVLLAVLLTVT
jgi:hypothetical protein